MQPAFNPSEIKKLSDIWSNITNPSTTDSTSETEKPEVPETPEASTETGVEEPEVEVNPVHDKLLHQYVEWIANRRIKALGLKPIYDIPAKNNPLPWTEHWISSKGLQVAPQETEVESYIVGGIKQDVTEKSFAGFQL